MISRVIKKIFAEEINCEEEDIDMDSEFYQDMMLEKDDLLDIISIIEDELDVDIPESVIDDFETPRDVMKYIKKSL